MKITDRLNQDTQTIGELWESLATFCNNRIEDNKRNEQYPLDTRISQMAHLQSLVNAIYATHDKYIEE